MAKQQMANEGILAMELISSTNLTGTQEPLQT